MNLVRAAAIILTQLPLVLFLGAKYDLIFGFNRMDAGFGTLLFLFFAVPLLNLGWTVAEIVRAWRAPTPRPVRAALLWPLLAAVFLLESLATDLYIASHARM